MKKCSSCGALKHLECFYVDNFQRNKTGRQSRCIECAKKQAAAKRAADPAKAAADVKAWHRRNPDKSQAIHKRKRARKPELYKALDRAKSQRYRKQHPD